jgi:hypothetical protein
MCSPGPGGTGSVYAASLPRPAMPTRHGAPVAAMSMAVVSDGAVTMQSTTAS